MTDPLSSFLSEPDAAHPGWMSWELADQTRYNAFLGRLLVSKGEDGKAHTRMFPERRHSNLGDAIHGGTITGFVDISLFAGARMFGMLDPGPAVTVDLSFHFVGAGRMDAPLDCEIELVKETGRLLFLRGLVVQQGETIASWTGTIRKPSKR